MKKLPLFFAFIAISLTAISQNDLKKEESASTPRKLRLGIGLGIGSTYRYGGLWLAKMAPSIHVEPQYRISKGLYVGLRLENSFLKNYRATYTIDAKTSNEYGQIKANSLFSWALTIEKHFKNDLKTFAPFVGAGIGTFYRGQGQLMAYNNKEVALGTCSGLLFRAGLASSKFSFMAEVNPLWENNEHGKFRSWWGDSGEYRGRSYASIKGTYFF
ncbi:hypothetical protein [Runella limosa]|uniref:hypothetical protein n=1 Tax=Runella limosa TaxID=370978 RepID=UPI000427D553|nr:hypothetical protein [Runella limosa]